MRRAGRSRTLVTLLVRGAQLGALVLIVAAVYALVVLGIGGVPTSRQSTLLGFSALAAAVAAVLYAGVRERVAVRARLVVDPMGSERDVVRMFSRRVAADLPVDELLPVLIESLGSGLRLSRTEVWLHSAGLLKLAAADPPRPRGPIVLGNVEAALTRRAGVIGRSWLELWLPALLEDHDRTHVRAAPLVHAGELTGLLVVARDGAGLPFEAGDDETLAAIARHAALALRTVRLGTELESSLRELRVHADALRESRTRVVAAADAERRRIERDLHDGAQQHLLGLAVNLRVAREHLARDPARADALLAQLSVEIHTALDQLRDVAHGIYPPLLAERGLEEAVRATLLRLGARGSVHANGLVRPAAEIESTVYFCCIEAIQNAIKHAPDARVDVRLWTEDGTLLFEVADDGPGFDPTGVVEGAGLTNMRDRVGALGGTLRVDAAVGRGTAVTGGLPVASEAVRAGTAARP